MNARLEEQLTTLINQFCEENVSNTPDYILGKYLANCLENFHVCVNLREQWFDKMTDSVTDDENELRFSSSIPYDDEELHSIGDTDTFGIMSSLSVNDAVSTNFLEEKRFIATDYVHLSVMLMDIEHRPGNYYDFFDDTLIVAVVKPNGIVVIKTDPLVGDVLEMLK
jgi:hypothetical protein